MNSIKLAEAIEACGFLYRSYSGRGMYGRECIGVEVDRHSLDSSFSLGVKLAAYFAENEEWDDLTNLQELRVCQDSMGLDTIYYFPDCEYPHDLIEKDDEEGAQVECNECGVLLLCDDDDDPLCDSCKEEPSKT